jgi:Icc protein
VTQTLLNFIHLSDTHLHINPAFNGDGNNPFTPLQGTNALIQNISTLPFPIDFVLHTGDVMNDPDVEEDYQIAREVLSKIKYPIYYLPGNHDKPKGIRRVLNGTAHTYYDFEVNGIQIAALDSKIPGSHAGLISDEQMDWLNDLCTAPDNRPLIVALHHHPIPLNISWLDEIVLQNGEKLHQTLLKARNRLRCVLYGHIHEQTTTIRDGITYISTLSAWFQTRTWSGQTGPSHDPVQLPGFNVVTLTDRETRVRAYRVPMIPG